MPEISYYECDGPGCEVTEQMRVVDGNGRSAEGMSFARVEVKVARWPGMKTGAFRYCSSRCLVGHLAPSVLLAPEYVS